VTTLLFPLPIVDERMPDGFEPKTELDRIFTLRELMLECRKRVPVILAELDSILLDDEVDKRTKLAAMEMALNRAYGKPRQHVFVSDDTSNTSSRRVQVYIPDNGRPTTINRTIDGEVG
jgi:hypothetical protein